MLFHRSKKLDMSFLLKDDTVELYAVDLRIRIQSVKKQFFVSNINLNWALKATYPNM